MLPLIGNCNNANILCIRYAFFGVVLMSYVYKYSNLVLGGGGIKGVAYGGMFEVADQRGYRFGNIAGVSAGSLAGAYKAAGYSAYELRRILYDFDFKKVEVDSIPKRVPAVARFMQYASGLRTYDNQAVLSFLNTQGNRDSIAAGGQNSNNRGSVFNSIVTFAKEGCLFDGDYLEEWVAKVLARRGIRTFGDLRGGIVDSTNPRGYKVRMTGVDCNRVKIVTLPDDISFYGINPDDFEVSKAVRISTCVPFAFKPVEIKKREGDSIRTYHLVDGGVLDSFPYWLVDSAHIPAIGYSLNGGGKKRVFTLDTPLSIFKALVSAMFDIGGPKEGKNSIKFMGEIDTTKVPFLDFGLSDDEKQYLYDAGKATATSVFNKFESSFPNPRFYMPRPFFYFYRRPF
jgi:NTE family protein